MKGNNDGGRGAREIFPRRRQSGITVLVLLAILVGGNTPGSYAADTFQRAALNVESDAFPFPETGPMRDELRCLPSTGTNAGMAFSDEIAVGTNGRLHRASLRVAAGKLPFWTLSAGANDADSCNEMDGSFQRVNRGLILSVGMDDAVGTADTSGLSDSSGYMVVAAENRSAGPHKSTSGVRYTDTPGHKPSDLVPGNDALTSQIPEPRIYAMMLAGLGLMGLVASHRQT